jgi:hypothetical protein
MTRYVKVGNNRKTEQLLINSDIEKNLIQNFHI